MPAQSKGLNTEVFESEHPTVVDFLREKLSPSHTELQSLHIALYEDNRSVSVVSKLEPLCGFTFALYFTHFPRRCCGFCVGFYLHAASDA